MKSVLKMMPVLLAITTFTSCTNYGKKVNIEGTKGEVYYKGEGVTESDAKKLGDYLKSSGMLTAGDDKKKTAQITKQGDRYVVHFVINKDTLAKNPEIEQYFKLMTAEIAKAVFNGQKTDIAFADDNLKDFKTIPYDEQIAQEKKMPDTGNQTGKDDGDAGSNSTISSLKDYDSDEAGGIKFYWKGITDDESKTIADYIVKNGSFYTTQGNVNIIMEKEGGKYVVKFPVADQYLKDPSILDELKKVSKQIKENVFANDAYSFVMTDTELNNIRSWDY